MQAVSVVVNALSSFGYQIRRVPVPVPAGTSVKHPVAAGTTYNVIATPPGFDVSKPHVIVGAHLDTVHGAPGANDNASGIAMMIECARLARVQPTMMPVQWIAFGGEERRRKGRDGALFGSRAYLAAMPQAERDALRGVIALDVLGRGQRLQASSGGATPHRILDAFVATATRMHVPASRTVVTRFFSDHKPFEESGFTVAWLWTGEFPQVHTPKDTIEIIDRSTLDAMGPVIWETIRALRL
ncbi:MAG: hypothetical protein NVSMB57_16130 [Actinomycetota bacterium]